MREGWKEIRFDRFIKLNRGFDLPGEKVTLGMYPVVASTSIKAYHNECKALAPGVVTGRSGSLGSVQYIKEQFWPLNTTLYVKDFKGNDPRFVFYFLQMMNLDSFNSGAGVPSLNQNHLHGVKVKIPSTINIQQKIASTLSAYDDLIEVNNKRIKLLEESARELYKEWFVRMRFPGFEETKFVKGVPEGWSIETLFSIAAISGGGTPKTSNTEYWEGDIPFYTPTDYCNQFFSFHTEKRITEKGLVNSSTRLFKENTIFITARGSVGNISIAGEAMAMNQSCFAISAKEGGDNYFLFCFVENMVSYLKLIANGATFDAFNLKTFQLYKDLIATKKIRDLFSIYATPLFEEIKHLQQQNHQLAATRDRLLPRLISGELEIK
ncbi:MAG: restriction endonuclease subunit S [Phocaeicola sp.]